MALATAARERGEMLGPRAEHDAVLKARQLLERLLTPEQLSHYRRHEQILVCTATGNYCIAAGQRIKAARDGRDFELCIQFAHPADSAWLPPEDLMIAQLLLIRTDEEGLWKRFGPPPYDDRRVDIPQGYVFGRGVLIATGHRRRLAADECWDSEDPRRISTTCYVGPPVHFTEELVPVEPRTLPLER
jgi:hypothetical protein